MVSLMTLVSTTFPRSRKRQRLQRLRPEKEIAVAKAEADRQSNDARINSEREIAIKNNELDMQKAGASEKRGQQAGGSGCGI